MRSVKRAVTSVYDKSAAGASCERRMATWPLLKTSNVAVGVEWLHAPRMMLAWCCSTMAVQQAGVCHVEF